MIITELSIGSRQHIKIFNSEGASRLIDVSIELVQNHLEILFMDQESQISFTQ